jgi:quercetin dioxygenase-like cupin family protein
MHYVSSLDKIIASTPSIYIGKSKDFKRQTYVDHAVGSVHMGVGISELGRDGSIQHHLHSFEESFYILQGSARLQVGGQTYALRPGHFGLIPTGTPHAWQNLDNQPTQWVEMQSPQPRPAERGRDTFFVAGQFSEEAGEPNPKNSSTTFISYFDESQLPQPGQKSEMEGFNPLSGVAIKMFVDRSFGATHQSLFLIQYQPGAKIDAHDHTFEESYYIVKGRVKAIADGKTYDLGPGDVIWTSVGCVHSFENAGSEPVRWIETQASLPPAKEIFRFEKDWAEYA